MLKFMNPQGHVVLNGDDDKLIHIREFYDVMPTFYGLDPTLPFYAQDIDDRGLSGTTATYVTPSSTFEAHINVPGKFMVYNALAAIAIAHDLGMSEEAIIEGIGALKPIAGRSNIIKTDSYTLIDDCYNASPASVLAALSLLAQADMRKVAILGDMFELGNKEKSHHTEVGLAAAEHGIDVLICIGDLSEYTYKGAIKNGMTEVHLYKDNAEFLSAMDGILQTDDTILLKASHGMNFGEILDVLKNK